MNSFYDLASSRRSIRKFEDREVPVEDIEYFIRTAVTAPSGCNSQCWKFVAVTDRNIIGQMEEAVYKSLYKLLDVEKNRLDENYISSKRKMVGFFAKAPVVIAVFMTETSFYDPVMINTLKQKGYDEKGIMDMLANYDLLSVGAAVQNLLLAVQEKGYGACWMNEPAIAGEAMNRILKVPEEHKFISLIPVGHPAYIPREKKMKEFSEVFSIYGKDTLR